MLSDRYDKTNKAKNSPACKKKLLASRAAKANASAGRKKSAAAPVEKATDEASPAKYVCVLRSRYKMQAASARPQFTT